MRDFMRRISWRRLLWIIAVVVPIAAGGFILWSKTRDLSRYQSRITEQVRKVTGRELAAKVPLQVRLSREPALVAEGVTADDDRVGPAGDQAGDVLDDDRLAEHHAA